MNIAFSAVIIFVLILPAIVFRKFCLPGKQSEPMTEQLARGLGIAVLSHAIWIPIANWVGGQFWQGRTVDLESAVFLCMSRFGYQDQKLQASVDSLVQHPLPVFAYFLTLCTVSGLAGYSVRRLRAYKPFNIGKAVTLLFGADSDEKRTEEWLGVLEHQTKAESRLVLVAAIVTVGGKCFIYEGQLKKVYWGKDGDPDHFELETVYRRSLDDDDPATDKLPPNPEKDRRYYIPGNTFVIRYSDITTLNIRQFKVTTEETTEDEEGVEETT